jgi:hypothetical protein
MLQKTLASLCFILCFSLSSGVAVADGHSKSKWVDISKDTKPFDKNCDYKVWVLENGEWAETWYLEAFDAENAFYTINRLSSGWTDKDAFYALNHKDKSKFLIDDNFIDVKTFSLCLKHN